MGNAVFVGVPEPGRLGGLVVQDGYIIPHGQRDGIAVGDGGGPGHPPLIGQAPAVAIVGKAQPELFGGDFREGVLNDPPDVGQGGHRHGRAVCICPHRLTAIPLSRAAGRGEKRKAPGIGHSSARPPFCGTPPG
ncbi:hypothetical protein SDC9_183198 [bioreactor metagenome]|uniref:Uncharacterized protein n=1 Tax=bioreactor metagenome TaxID=1076179 RepID=A0A645HAG8_9ZZZZ